MYGYVRDAYYNFRFKTKAAVTTPKQLAISLSLANDMELSAKQDNFGSRSAFVSHEQEITLSEG